MTKTDTYKDAIDALFYRIQVLEHGLGHGMWRHEDSDRYHMELVACLSARNYLKRTKAAGETQ